MLDLQKATMSKRISAFLADIIALFMVAIGISTVFANIVGYDAKSEQLQAIYDAYEQEYIYDVFNATYGTETGPYSKEEIKKIIKEDEATYLEWYKAREAEANAELNKDTEAKELYGVVINLSIFNVMISVLIAYALLEFVVPLLLKNGQTIGKKVFGIGLMRADGLKLSPLQLAIRTFLGKYTIETMIPVLVFMAMSFSVMSPDFVLLGLGVVAVIVIAECILFFKSDMTHFIHDTMAMTVCIDIQSQLIFETEEELIAYKEKVAAENAGKLGYGGESATSVYSSFSCTAVEIDDDMSEKTHKEDNDENDNIPTLTLSTISVGDENFVNTDVAATEVDEETSEEQIEDEAPETEDAAEETLEDTQDEEISEEISEELESEETESEEAEESKEESEEN